MRNVWYVATRNRQFGPFPNESLAKDFSKWLLESSDLEATYIYIWEVNE